MAPLVMMMMKRAANASRGERRRNASGTLTPLDAAAATRAVIPTDVAPALFYSLECLDPAPPRDFDVRLFVSASGASRGPCNEGPRRF